MASVILLYSENSGGIKATSQDFQKRDRFLKDRYEAAMAIPAEGLG